MEVDVEVNAKLVQGLLDVREHHLHASGAELLADLVLGALECIGDLLLDIGCNLLNVLSAIAVLRSRLALGRSHERVGEAVDLAAMIVEVVLAGYLSAGGFEHAAEGIAHGCPTGAAQVDRTGGVSGDEFEVNLLAFVGIVVAVVSAGLADLVHDGALCGGSQADVQEARACDLGDVNGVVLSQRLGQPGGQLARIHAGLLGYLQGKVGGVVTVLGITRTLHGHGLRKDGGVELVFAQYSDCGLFNKHRKIYGIHSVKVYRPALT